MIGIYKIQSKTNSDRIYIGSSKDISDRWRLHISDLRKNRHHSIKLQRHYNKYGEEDLRFEILNECNLDNLIKKEQCYLNVFQPYFNICKIAKSRLGVKGQVAWNKGKKGIYSKETLKKMRRPRPDMIGNKINVGRKQSDEAKQKKREASLRNGNKPPSHLGKKRSEETKLLMSLVRVGKKLPRK